MSSYRIYGYFVVIVVGSMFLLCGAASAQTAPLDYGNETITDRDLDGLTDKGETDIYKTDPFSADTDGDGFLDGAEVLSNTDPLDSSSNIKARKEKKVALEKETPWAWYIARASGLVAFVLLYLSFFVGFAIRVRWFRGLLKFINFNAFHCWVSLQALIFTVIHAGALLFDKYLQFRLQDILIPFVSAYRPSMIALGVLALYIIIVLIVSSYMRSKISHQTWRVLHSFNIILYVFVFIHSWQLGTDFKNPIVANTAIVATLILAILAVLNIHQRIIISLSQKDTQTPHQPPPSPPAT